MSIEVRAVRAIDLSSKPVSATDTVAVNRHEWTDEKGEQVYILPGDPLDPKMPGYSEAQAKGMTRAEFVAIEDDDRAKRIGGLRKRIAELQADIDVLEAEDADLKARRAAP